MHASSLLNNFILEITGDVFGLCTHTHLYFFQVIVKRDDKITLYCKGAGRSITTTRVCSVHCSNVFDFTDSVVFARLEKASAELMNTTIQHLSVDTVFFTRTQYNKM